MLLGKLFTLLPWGDVAYRLNLLSAVCASMAVVLLYGTSITLLRPKPYAALSALCAALLLATSRLFWSQALITEVYALNCLFFAVTLYGVVTLQDSLQEWPVRLVWQVLSLLVWTYGVSLGNHLTMVFCAPLLLSQALLIFRKRVLKTWQWTVISGAFLLGISVYTYLPLRAGTQPLMNWGNPRTLRGFLWLVGGGIYRQYVLSLPWAHWGARIMAWMSLLRQQFGVFGIALGLLGAWHHAGSRRWQFAGLAGTFTIYSVYAIGYNTTDSYVYLLPVHFLYALWIAHGAQALLIATARAQSQWSQPATVVLCITLLALPCASLRTNLPVVDLSNDYTAYDYGLEVLAQVPDQSIIITATDPHTFTLWYFARVATGRTQVAVIDRDLLGYAWYVGGLRASYPWIRLPRPSPGEAIALGSLIDANVERLEIFLADKDAQLTSQYHCRKQGSLYRLDAK